MISKEFLNDVQRRYAAASQQVAAAAGSLTVEAFPPEFWLAAIKKMLIALDLARTVIEGKVAPDAVLATRVAELEAAIRNHRDQRGDDRCWLDDDALYAVLPEGKGEADTRLHCPEEMLANCQRYIASRQEGGVPYVSPQRQIDTLQAVCREALQLLTTPRPLDQPEERTAFVAELHILATKLNEVV